MTVQVKLTAAQLTKFANLPRGSLAFYIAGGVLEPSVRRAGSKGQPHLFSFKDLVVAKSIAQIRLQSVSMEGMRGMAAFWRSDDGAKLLESIGAEVKKKADGSYQQTSEEKIFVVLANGRLEVETNRPIRDITREHKSAIVHVVDAALLAEQAVVDVTEAILRLEFVQPGPGGRVPREAPKKRAERKVKRAGAKKRMPKSKSKQGSRR
jgi:hypothetical protein